MMLNVTLFRIAIGRAFKWLRHGLLRVFGAKIDKDAYIYPHVRYSCLGLLLVAILQSL